MLNFNDHVKRETKHLIAITDEMNEIQKNIKKLEKELANKKAEGDKQSAHLVYLLPPFLPPTFVKIDGGGYVIEVKGNPETLNRCVVITEVDFIT